MNNDGPAKSDLEDLSPPTLLTRLASACLGGVLRFDYLGANPHGAPGPASRSGHGGWWPAARKASPDDAGPSQPAAAAPAPSSPRTSAGSLSMETGQLQELSSSAEYRLVARARGGCERARAQLIERHLPLVKSVARRFGNRRLPVDDLINEGSIGLMKAVEKFDAERGYRLSTYARWWIGQAMALAIMNQSNVVRVPVHVQRAARKAYKEDQAAEHEVGAQAEYAESQPGESRDLSAGRVEAVDIGDDMLDSLASPKEDQPMNILGRLEESMVLEKALDGLSAREQLVVRARFGLDDDEAKTLEKIGAQLQLSDERIRQILKTAMAKLRDEISRHGISDAGSS